MSRSKENRDPQVSLATQHVEGGDADVLTEVEADQVQGGLRIESASDPMEHEADRVAGSIAR